MARTAVVQEVIVDDSFIIGSSIAFKRQAMGNPIPNIVLFDEEPCIVCGAPNSTCTEDHSVISGDRPGAAVAAPRGGRSRKTTSRSAAKRTGAKRTSAKRAAKKTSAKKTSAAKKSTAKRAASPIAARRASAQQRSEADTIRKLRSNVSNSSTVNRQRGYQRALDKAEAAYRRKYNRSPGRRIGQL